MIPAKRLALGALLLGIATATVVPFMSHGTRGVRLYEEPPRGASTRFDPRQSAALFVGVREFRSADAVPYAVDDAVDLAYAFALQRPRVRLVSPRRVMLLLSDDDPVKPQSIEHLRALQNAGAEVRYHTDTAHIATALREQAARAGGDGVLIVSIAAHGLLHDGSGYILGASSLIGDPATMLSHNDIFETIATSPAQRSLVFIDACRERLVTGTRSVLAGALSAAPLMRRLGRTRGQAVFYAAAAGKWAYDDPKARNGVFTKAVIEGINCGAPKLREFVTADTLAGYVERSVQKWIRENRDPNVGSATQASIDGDARDMPVARCVDGPVAGLHHAAPAGTTVQAFSDKNELLWQRDGGGVVTRADAADLDADGYPEAIFSTRDRITVLDDGGSRLWSVHEPMTLTAFATGDLFRRNTNEVVALWSGEHSSRIAIYDADGSNHGTLDDTRRIDHIAVVRPTKRFKSRIVGTAGDVVFAFDPKTLSTGKPLWACRVVPHADIASLAVVDGEGDGKGDGKGDIAITTASGAKVFLDVNGRTVRSHGARVERISGRRR